MFGAIAHLGVLERGTLPPAVAANEGERLELVVLVVLGGLGLAEATDRENGGYILFIEDGDRDRLDNHLRAALPLGQHVDVGALDLGASQQRVAQENDVGGVFGELARVGGRVCRVPGSGDADEEVFDGVLGCLSRCSYGDPFLLSRFVIMVGGATGPSWSCVVSHHARPCSEPESMSSASLHT